MRPELTGGLPLCHDNPALLAHSWGVDSPGKPLLWGMAQALLRALSLASILSACAALPLDLTPGPTPPATCPVEGCTNARAEKTEESRLSPGVPRSPGVCPGSGAGACGGASGEACTERALARWTNAGDPRRLECVAAMLLEACDLGDAHACGYGGRLLLDGRGAAKNEPRAVSLLSRACDDGDARACLVGVRLLADPARARAVEGGAELRGRLESEQGCLLGQADECYKVGLGYSFGQKPFPEDRPRAAKAYERGCNLGEPSACNNLGDAFAYGDGVARDVEAAATLFERACRLGAALGCSNLGYMVQHGAGRPRDLAGARALYRGACVSGDVYGCVHADMLAAEDAGAPRDPDASFSHWLKACEREKNARACTFLGILYEDGPDGLSRDPKKSSQAMARGCRLGDRRACDWSKLHGD